MPERPQTHVVNRLANTLQELPAGPERLSTFLVDDPGLLEASVSALREDQVVLVQGAAPGEADDLMARIADAFDLKHALEMQAAYAGILRHRRNVSKYFMTVNQRGDHQFVKPHSEGTWLINMQLAAFYCVNNSTDGGETLLFNVDNASQEWRHVREMVPRMVSSGRGLTPSELALAKVVLKLDPDAPTILPGDTLLEELPSPIQGIKFANVLTPLRSRRSCLTGHEVHTIWDSVSSPDLKATEEFFAFLSDENLVRLPSSAASMRDMDAGDLRITWHSKVNYSRLFRHRMIRRLTAGDLIVFNNLTWTHATNNWTPSSGEREVWAAFA